MVDTSGITCRGSWALGSACGRCNKCEEEQRQLEAKGEWPSRIAALRAWFELRRTPKITSSIPPGRIEAYVLGCVCPADAPPLCKNQHCPRKEKCEV